MKAASWYAVYFASKQWAMAIALIVLALLFRREINASYSSPSQCRACADLSKTNPTTAFEFSACSGSLTPQLEGSNLLTDGLLTPHSSPVPMMLVSALCLAAVALLYTAKLVWFDSDGDFSLGAFTSVYNVLLTLLWLMVSGNFFQLYLKGGCWVSPWSTDLLFANYVANLVVLFPILIYVLYEVACGRNTPYPVTVVWFWLSVLSYVAFLGWTFTLAVMNGQHSGMWTHLIFVASITVLCILDVSVFRQCFGQLPADYNEAQGKQGISAAQQSNTFTDIVS
jgi:hypothetical protein